MNGGGRLGYWLLGALVTVLLAVMGLLYSGFNSRLDLLEATSRTNTERTVRLETQYTEILRRLAIISTQLSQPKTREFCALYPDTC